MPTGKRFPPAVVIPAVALFVLAASDLLRAEEPQQQAPLTVPAQAAEPAKFMRFVEDGRAGGRLETAVVTYRNEAGVDVKLVAAVHIGEKAYFQELAKSFQGEDAVLYELIKPKDAVLPAPGAPRVNPDGEAGEGHPVAQLQRFLKDSLNLSFQLDEIDYRAKNFVHADLDAETFEKMQAERGEGFAQLMLKQLMNAMTNPEAAGAGALGGDPDAMIRDLIKVLTRPDMERQVKLFIARQLDSMENVAAGLDGPEGSVILTERNKAAMVVLGETLKDAGKRKIAVFYGAAHMPDLAKRLREQGFKPVATEWRPAWDLTIRADQPSGIETLLLEAVKVLEEGDGGFGF